ncbi:MAG TPA: AraC family transcriptional regulator, partial [Gemmatimonadaceae bacterium]|nr:AraC family transcriptional regulator [Gemmatimonadaceae bacterium]
MSPLVWRRPAVADDLQLLSGDLDRDPFPAMLVDSFLVGYYVQGAVNILHRGRVLPFVGGEVCLYEPQELVYTDQRRSERGIFHVVLTPVEAMRRAAVDIRDHDRTEAFGCRILRDLPPQAIRRFVDAVLAGAPVLEQETRWIEAAAALLGDAGVTADRPRALSRQVRRAREYLHAHVASPVPLETLATMVGASKYHLVREFHRTLGLPPHKYHLRLRLGRARELLAAGVGSADVATDLGFADQSHFYRSFKRAFGITPGAWAALFA